MAKIEHPIWPSGHTASGLFSEVIFHFLHIHFLLAKTWMRRMLHFLFTMSFKIVSMMLQLTIVLSTSNDDVNIEPLAIVVDNDAVVEAIVVDVDDAAVVEIIVVGTIVIQMALL